MSALVQALKAEHVNIGKILGKAGELGVNTKAGRKALMAAKTGLLAHLKREGEQLYPTLAKAAEDDPVLGDALDFFLEDIEGVATAALAFFDKVEAGAAGDDFAADFSEFASLLSRRIQKEEAVIYKMYDQLDEEI